MNLCDINVIKEILTRHGFNFSKSLGQNFLTDEYIPAEIARLCGADKNSSCVEIGAGMGCLTKELANVCEKVVSVELDRALFPVLEETLADFSNIEIVHGDVLKTDFKKLVKEKLSDKPVYACANLPYYITSPAISVLLDSGIFEKITVMVQKEVAERICAKEGTKAYSAFTIYVNYYADSEIVLNVPRDCFVPQPKVDSAVISLTPRKKDIYNVENEKLFFSMVKASFSQRRKTLINSVSTAFGGKLDKNEILDLVLNAGFDEKIRGERLSIEDFARLSNIANQKINAKTKP